MKINQAAKELAITVRKLKQLCKEGMPHLHIPDCGVRINLADAIAWIKNESDREKALKIQGIREDLKMRKKALRSFYPDVRITR